MTGPVVNLNKARKALARAQARVTADRNAVLHGLPKAEKARESARAEQERARLEGHRRDKDKP